MVKKYDKISKKKKATLARYRPFAEAKIRKLLDNIEELVDRASKMARLRDGDIYESLGIDTSKWADKNKPEDSMTIRQLLTLETYFHSPLVSINDLASQIVDVVARHDTLQAKLGWDLKLHPDIPEEMLDELIEANANWRVVFHSDQKYVTFAVPKRLADKYGMQYVVNWWEEDGRFVLTDDGYVVRALSRRFNPAGMHYINTQFGGGQFYKGKHHLSTLSSAKALLLGKPNWIMNRPDHLRFNTELVDDIRKEAFAVAYVATGDCNLAASLAKHGANLKNAELSRLIKSSKVVQMVEERTRKAMESAFIKLGLTHNPEEFVVGTLIEMTTMIMDRAKEDDSQLNPKLLTVVQENIDKLSDFLAMKSENRMVTTERSLELGEGDRFLIAKEIERRKSGELPPTEVSSFDTIEIEEADSDESN